MKHKRQHTNGVVSKEERTNRIRQLLGSPTAMRLQTTKVEEETNPTSDVTNTEDDDDEDAEEKFDLSKFDEKRKKKTKKSEMNDEIGLDRKPDPLGPNVTADVCAVFEEGLPKDPPNMLPMITTDVVNYFQNPSTEIPLSADLPYEQYLSEEFSLTSTSTASATSISTKPQPEDIDYSNYYQASQCGCCTSKSNGTYQPCYQHYNNGQEACDQSFEQQHHHQQQQQLQLQQQHYYYPGYDYSDYYDTNWQFGSDQHMQQHINTQVSEYPYHGEAFH